MPSSNWPIIFSWPNAQYWPTTIPGSVASNIVSWFDGRQPQYSDAAGTALVTAVRSPVRRMNESLPLAGNWQAPSDAQRPGRDLAGLRSDLIGPSSMVRSANIGVSSLNSTIVTSFVVRGNTTYSSQGLIVCRGGVKNQGLSLFQGGFLGLYYDINGMYITAIPNPPLGSRCTICAIYGASDVRVRMIVNGRSTDYVVTPGFADITTVNPPELFPALVGGAFYGSMAQALVLNRAISATEGADLSAWCDSQLTPPAFPTDGQLLGVIGDSIAAESAGWSTQSLGGLRPTYQNLELCNLAVPGTFSSNLPIQYAAIDQFRSTARSRNTLIIAIGTNDLAGSLTPESVRDNIFAQADIARAAGWRVAIATILPRTVGALGSAPQLAFNAARATLNGYIITNGPTHADAIVNITGVAGMGADGDSNNAVNYPDGIHPSAPSPGHALLTPTYQAAANTLLA